MINVGIIIRKIRLKKRIKQKDLAKMANMCSSSLCDIEKGRVNPSLKTLYKIADALNEPLSSFIPEEDKNGLQDKSHYQKTKEEIERKRKELYGMYERKDNLQEEEILKKSRELDELIKKLYK